MDEHGNWSEDQNEILFKKDSSALVHQPTPLSKDISKKNNEWSTREAKEDEISK